VLKTRCHSEIEATMVLVKNSQAQQWWSHSQYREKTSTALIVPADCQSGPMGRRSNKGAEDIELKFQQSKVLVKSSPSPAAVVLASQHRIPVPARCQSQQECQRRTHTARSRLKVPEDIEMEATKGAGELINSAAVVLGFPAPVLSTSTDTESQQECRDPWGRARL
jgi:hypothetical protein